MEAPFNLKVQPKGYAAFLNIRTLEDAVKWSGTSASVLNSYIKTLGDPTMQQKSATHVGRALEFRGSPQNHMKLENTAWRGTRNDNQFLIGPKDPMLTLELYNKILPKTKPTSTNSFAAVLNKWHPGGLPEPRDVQIRKTENRNPFTELFIKSLQNITNPHSLTISR